MSKVFTKQERHNKLLQLMKEDPFLTDKELAKLLEVSVPTVRLDRTELRIPELRKRVKDMAYESRGKIQSIDSEDIVGEIVDLELNQRGISIMEAQEYMSFGRCDLIRGNYLFAQANTLAVAMVDSPVALTGTSQVKFVRPVKVGERLVAKGEVTQARKKQFRIRVEINSERETVFKAKFLIISLENEQDKQYSWKNKEN